jgi:hypothetical protein
MEFGELIRAIAGMKTGPLNRTVTGSFFLQGVVEQVFGNGGIMVNTSAGVVIAKPVTDEPMQVGMRVWVSSTADKNTWLIHGGVR